MDDIHRTLSGKYPAKAHAAKVVDYLKSKVPNVNGVIYLEGQKTRMIEDNDEAIPFRLDLIRAGGRFLTDSTDKEGTSTISQAAMYQTATWPIISKGLTSRSSFRPLNPILSSGLVYLSHSTKH